MAVVQVWVEALVHLRLAHPSGLLVGIGREVDESRFTAADVAFGRVGTNRVGGALVLTVFAFVYESDASTSGLVNRVGTLIEKVCRAGADEAVISVKTFCFPGTVVLSVETFVDQANFSGRMALLSRCALTGVIAARRM